MSINQAPNPYIPNLYNSNDFNSQSTTLTQANADARYLQLTGGTLTGILSINSNVSITGSLTMALSSLIIGSTTVTATGAQLNYLSGVTLGTGTPSSALVLNASSDLILPGNLTFSGTSKTLAMGSNNITSTGSITNASQIIGTTTSGSNNALLTIHTNDNETSGTLTITGGTSSVVNTQLQYSTNQAYWGNQSNHAFSLMTNNSTRMTISPTGNIAIGNGTPSYLLDFGTAANDVEINLYQSGSNALYGLGVSTSNSAFEMHSGGSFTWYNGTTGNGSLGTKSATLYNGGNLTCTSGQFTGFSATVASVQCLKCHFGGGAGQLFSYDYGAGTPLTTNIGYTTGGNFHIVCTTNTANAFVNINTINSSGVAPLSVYGSSNFSRNTGSYGFLNNSGSGNVNSANFSNRAFSCYMDYGILVGVAGSEIDCFSDIRMKKNIIALDDDLVNRFINNIEPISFQYKENESTTKNYGYKAQQLVEHLFTDLVGFTDIIEDHDLEPEDIKCIDGSIVHLKDNQKLVVSLMNVIPILHRCIQLSNQKIQDNQNEIALLKFKLAQSTIVEASTTTPLNYDNSILNVVTEANFKQQSINGNLDQRIALLEQKSIINVSLNSQQSELILTRCISLEARIIELENLMNRLKTCSISSAMW